MLTQSKSICYLGLLADAGSGYQTQEFTSLTDINNIISAVQQPDNVVADIILNIVEESSSTSLSLSYESSEEVSETTSSVTYVYPIIL